MISVSRALTLIRPWDEFILRGWKPIENRTWRTKHRGWIGVHAGKSYDPWAIGLALEADRALRAAIDTGRLNVWTNTPQGVIRGVVKVTDICERSRWTEELDCDCGPWAGIGKYHWKLSHPVLLPTPLPVRGGLSLWTIPEQAREPLEALI